MAHIEVEVYVDCPPQKVRELLLDARFLDAFVEGQLPTERHVEVKADEGQSAAKWTVKLPADVPGLVRRFVGEKFVLDLRIDVGAKSRLHLDAAGKKIGTMGASLDLEPHGPGTNVKLHGEVKVAAGLLSGQAENLARDQVLKPVIREDLLGLLQTWCVEQPPS